MPDVPLFLGVPGQNREASQVQHFPCPQLCYEAYFIFTGFTRVKSRLHVIGRVVHSRAANQAP